MHCSRTDVSRRAGRAFERPRGAVELAWLGVLAALALAVGLCAAVAGDDDEPLSSSAHAEIRRLPPNPQELGDPARGLRYLLHGDYLGSGLPVELWKRLVPQPDLHPATLELAEAKLRDNSIPSMPYDTTRFVTGEGADVIGGVNCLGCHASMFRGELVIGLGNSLRDWTTDGPEPTALAIAGAASFAPGSAESRAMTRFVRGARVLHGKTRAPFRGLNPAFRIEEVAAAHRVPETLAWSAEPLYDVPDRVIASDVPPWWHIKKKHGLYYNGMGGGDYAKLLQQIGVVMIEDQRDAERITEGMRDLMAFLFTIEPPAYPWAIDADLAEVGRAVFENDCASCHGTYGRGRGDDWTYPNALVPIGIVGTDPEYARILKESALPGWYGKSWYAMAGRAEGEPPASYAEPELAYIAPPLDGIWASAPYFHNGSVPTLDAVLDSSLRPTLWKRSFRDDDYDPDRVGWRYTVPETADGPETYDTRVRGYSAGGHTFGDDLTDAERRAVLEYLKGL
ncbi:MAG: hypothetical protein AAF138_00725 [Planctomycetota bacterium]